MPLYLPVTAIPNGDDQSQRERDESRRTRKIRNGRERRNEESDTVHLGGVPRCPPLEMGRSGAREIEAGRAGKVPGS
ncbi:MAG TPA: hypothetical protein VH110_08390, partial [Candidatus Acidoferrum sp.]|nr:hypothetical protein [Candidatus Acidoferrum sp.]